MKRTKSARTHLEDRTIKRRDWILLLCLAVIAVGVLVGYQISSGGKTARNEIAVYVNGELYLTSPLKPGKDLVIRQEDGSENVIRMTETGFFMQSATCQNQDCIYQGSVTRENWKNRLLGTHVICLPNRVDVTLLVVNTDPNAPDA